MTPTEEQVEAVALALLPALWSPPTGSVTWTEELKERARAQSRDAARGFALAALPFLAYAVAPTALPWLAVPAVLIGIVGAVFSVGALVPIPVVLVWRALKDSDEKARRQRYGSA